MIARPGEGTPLLLAPTAALVWTAIEQWTTVDEVKRVLGDRHPEIGEDERADALERILSMLVDEGLVECAS